MSLTHSPSIPLSGLVLCVDAANTRIPAYGNTTVTPINGMSAAANGYYTFDGIDDTLSIDANVYNTTYTGKTIQAAIWIDPAWVANGYRGIIGTPSAVNSRNLNLYVFRDSGGIRMHFSPSSGSLNYGTVSGYLTSIATGQWCVVGISQVADGTVSYYYNGQVVSTATSSLTQFNSGTSEFLGSCDNYFQGRIAYWHVYNRALTDNEIKQSFNAMRGRFGI